jgi:hypothetical protein
MRSQSAEHAVPVAIQAPPVVSVSIWTDTVPETSTVAVQLSSNPATSTPSVEGNEPFPVTV